MIIDNITAEIIKRCRYWKELKVSDLCIGLKYAYCVVERNKKEIGLSYVPVEDILPHESTGEIKDVLSMVKSTKMLDRVIAIAYLNSVSQYMLWVERDYSCEIIEKKIFGFLEDKIGDKDNIIVIGNMVPLIERLGKKTKNIWVFERNPRMRIYGALSDCFEFRYLEESDIVIVTGTTLLNDTIDPILKYAKKAHTKVIVGPTAQLHPDVLLKYFDIVASLRVNEIEAVTKTIKLGGGRWSFSKFCSDYIAT
ncbi:MAG: DUF364 domain-containing protein [Candidatus Njordarchaeota archaeon]